MKREPLGHMRLCLGGSYYTVLYCALHRSKSKFYKNAIKRLQYDVKRAIYSRNMSKRPRTVNNREFHSFNEGCLAELIRLSKSLLTQIKYDGKI